ncbi:hypothetical protein [Colwellia sp. RSH04]|uniref:hypothetical protein n=1 Tax=Colwellia sp. RSH04 TaxID=2305464 RepID=UPI000E5684E2|nr:hypothetical protein [Colwellia sp. RSH04]RHW74861.1 hypothetical protein D1094_16420 [Colwellia sp. RSH04]
MQVTHSSINNATTPSLRRDAVQSTSVDQKVGPTKKAIESTDVESALYAPTRAQASIRFDEAAINFIENQKESTSQFNSNQTVINQEKASEQSINKEDISRQNQYAVNSYQGINNLAQRESVQQMLGVDLFA